jgi:hypothetical protein
VSVRRFVALVVLGVALVQAVWIAVLPPFRGIDEFDHVFRAASVARGEWVAGPYAEHGRGRLVTVPADIAQAASGQCWALPYTGVDNCFPVAVEKDGSVQIASSAGDYNPAFYWVIGTAARPFSGAAADYAMRIMTALLSTMLIGAAAWAFARGARTAWRLVGLLLALSPVGIYSTVVAAPNGPELAAGIALWCALLALPRATAASEQRAMLGVAGVSATLLCTLRGLGPGFAVLIVALCLTLAPRPLLRVLRERRLLVGGMAVALVAALGWVVAWGRMTSGGKPVVIDAIVPFDWGQPVAWLLGTVAAFPLRDQPAPTVVYAGFLAVFVAVWVLALRVASSRLRLVLGALTAGVLAMPFVLTALTYDSRGVIWQGRYGLPLAVGVPLVSALALDGSALGRRLRVERLLVVLLGALAIPCVLHVRTLELHRVASLSDAAWHRPSSALVVGVVGLLCVVWWAALRRRPDRA